MNGKKLVNSCTKGGSQNIVFSPLNNVKIFDTLTNLFLNAKTLVPFVGLFIKIISAAYECTVKLWSSDAALFYVIRERFC